MFDVPSLGSSNQNSHCHRFASNNFCLLSNTFSVIMQNIKLLLYEQQHDSTTPQHVPKTESKFTSSKVCIVDKDLQHHQASLGYNELHTEARTKLLPFFTHIFKTFFFSNLAEIYVWFYLKVNRIHSNNGLSLNSPQAITWTKVSDAIWYHATICIWLAAFISSFVTGN